MSDDNNIWERPLGLQGVWGSIIYDWLDELLPDDADLLVKEEVRRFMCECSDVFRICMRCMIYPQLMRCFIYG